MNNFFYIRLVLGYTCNFKCSYCVQKKNSSNFNQEYINAIKMSKLVNNIDLSEVKDKDIWLQIIGGETTLYPIKDMIDNISISISTLRISTNMSQDVSYYIDLYEFLKEKNINLVISASFHEEFISRDEYIRKIIILKNIGVSVSSQVTLTKNNYSYILGTLRYFKDNNITAIDITQSYYKDDDGNYQYGELEERQISEIHRICNGRIRFRNKNTDIVDGKYCDIAKRVMIIMPDGKIIFGSSHCKNDSNKNIFIDSDIKVRSSLWNYCTFKNCFWSGNKSLFSFVDEEGLSYK